jgi:hypothetical protein
LLPHYCRVPAGPVTDIWADEGAAAAAAAADKNADWTSHASGNELLRLAQLSKQQQQAAAASAKRSSSSKRKRPAPAPIAAVEIDLPGCSFNPEYEAHQDALAVAVAREYKQQLKEELAPKAPSLFAPAGGLQGFCHCCFWLSIVCFCWHPRLPHCLHQQVGLWLCCLAAMVSCSCLCHVLCIVLLRHLRCSRHRWALRFWVGQGSAVCFTSPMLLRHQRAQGTLAVRSSRWAVCCSCFWLQLFVLCVNAAKTPSLLFAPAGALMWCCSRFWCSCSASMLCM